MTKRLSIISIVVCPVAVVAGALFAPVQSAVYEFENGPPLITKGFYKRVARARDRDLKFVDDYRIGSDNSSLPGQFAIWLEKNPVDKNNTLTIGFEFTSGSYDITTTTFANFKPQSNEKFVFNERQVNQYIDKLYFPDRSTRAKKKREILNRIAELNKNDD